MRTFEVNFDGLVGPTHHYAGLAQGNLASIENAFHRANPKAAALQGIAKMRFLYELGLKQAFLPPPIRPNLTLLRQLGFEGTANACIEAAYRCNPQLLSACYSASSMWTANAATVSPSQDTTDRRIHFTPANLCSNLHRHQEPDFYNKLFPAIFNDRRYFAHHHSLPATLITSDEGAANYNRLALKHSEPGIAIFVYGKQALIPHHNKLKFPARQTREASEAVARAHQLSANGTFFVKQTDFAIDQGVFHNDVIAVANENVLLIHEHAWENQAGILKDINQTLNNQLIPVIVREADINLADAVSSYLFNSQLITLANQSMILISPQECETIPAVQQFINALIDDNSNPISAVYYLDLKQSMQNGGGPACLRLRIVMNEQELNATHPALLINPERLLMLEQWVHKHYRDSLDINDLRDPNLRKDSITAVLELAEQLNITAVYSDFIMDD